MWLGGPAGSYLQYQLVPTPRIIERPQPTTSRPKRCFIIHRRGPMERRAVIPACILACIVSLGTTPANAQRPQTRQGFWFNGGLGYGSLGCEDCSGRTGGLSGGLSLGGTISPKFLLGVGTTGWYKSEDGVTLTVGTLDARMRFYPSTKGGFFLTGGLGIGSISADVAGFGSGSETGVGLVLGLGFDIRVGTNVSLTPFWNGYAVRSSDTNANVGQLGLGITVH